MPTSARRMPVCNDCAKCREGYPMQQTWGEHPSEGLPAYADFQFAVRGQEKSLVVSAVSQSADYGTH